MSLILPAVKFKEFILELEKFDGKYFYCELSSGYFIEIETDYSCTPEEQPEANINFYINNGDFSMCITFHCFVNDISNMAINLGREMNRSDRTYDMYNFSYPLDK